MLSRGEDIVPLVGARTRDRLAEALGALELELTADDLAAIEDAVPAGRRRGRALRRGADGDARQRARLGCDAVTEATLTPERILEAAEDVLRRYGPAKATVVDVARELGVSHGSVYRHFPSKAALRDAVAERWLAGVSDPLAVLAAAEGPAPERLRRWLDLLISSKRSRALQDPELFATYVQLAGESREVITAHVGTLTEQLARIISDGVEQRRVRRRGPRCGGARGIRRHLALSQSRSRGAVVRPRDRR